MNCKTFQSKLLKARTYAEAQPILESIRASPSTHTLLQWAFNLPPNQAHFLNQAFQSAIQEAKIREEEERHGTREEEEERRGKMHEEEEERKGGHGTREEEEEEEEEEEGRRKVKEYEGGDGQISSDPGMEHLGREDQVSTHGENPITKFEGSENQMRETMRRNGVPEHIITKVLKEMDKTTATQRQVMETVISEIRRANAPVVKVLKMHESALKALNKKLQEVSTKQVSMPVTVPSANTPGQIRETRTNTVSLDSMWTPTRRQSIEDVRNEIKELDNAFSNGMLKNKAEPYQ